MAIRSETYFAIVPEWVLFADIAPQALRLYAVLNRYANEAGTAHPSRKTLAERMRVSVKTVDRSLDELQAIGAVDVAPRINENGDQSSNLYTVKVTPPGDKDDATPPDTDVPTPGDTDVAQKQSQLETKPSESEKYLGFETFWSVYPRHHSTGKPGGGAPKNLALRTWTKISDVDRAACMVAVKNYAAAMTLPNAPYPAMATTWLNQKRWQDWQEPADLSKARGPSPPRDRFAEMAERFERGEVGDGQANGVTDAARRRLPSGTRS